MQEVLECERIKQQQYRQQKRQTKKVSKLDSANKICKSVKGSSHDNKSNKLSDQKDLKSIEECIKDFHSSIALGLLYVCTCCHQTWFRKSVSMLKNTHIPVQSRIKIRNEIL